MCVVTRQEKDAAAAAGAPPPPGKRPLALERLPLGLGALPLSSAYSASARACARDGSGACGTKPALPANGAAKLSARGLIRVSDACGTTGSRDRTTQ